MLRRASTWRLKNLFNFTDVTFLWTIIALIGGFIALDVAASYYALEANLRFQASSYARLVAEHAEAVFKATDGALQYARNLAPPEALNDPRNLAPSMRDDIEARLKKIQQTSHGTVVSMTMTGADGYAFANSVGQPPGGNLGDRAYFLRLKAAADSQPVLSEAIYGRISKIWGVQMARRLESADNRFVGMVVANIGLAPAFSDFYANLNLPEGVSITLQDVESRLMVRYPVTEHAYGARLEAPESAIIARGGDNEITYRRASVIDQIPKIFVRRPLKRYPVQVSVGLPVSLYQDEWRRVALRDAGFMALLTAAAAAMTRLLRRRARMAEKLREANDHLKSAQENLVQSEKMAALGQLVAGVAHEINSPIGAAITAASMLVDETARFRAVARGAPLRRADFDAYMATSAEASEMILANLVRAADQVESFKQVAAGRARDEFEIFNLKCVLDDLAASLTPIWRRGGGRLTVDCPADVVMAGYPGALGQLVTILVFNSMDHGYPPDGGGVLTLRARPVEGGMIQLVYTDDGKGVPADLRAKAFEPFFTTRRAEGNTGLGLSIAYNLVCGRMGGDIILDPTHVGPGARFAIHVPRRGVPNAPKIISEKK